MSRNLNYTVDTTPMVAPPRDFRGVAPSVRESILSRDDTANIVQHLTFEIQRTLAQFYNPFLTFADMLASAIGQDTQRHDIIHSLELLPPGQPQVPKPPAPPGNAGIGRTYEQLREDLEKEVTDLFNRIHLENLPIHQRDALMMIVIDKMIEQVKNHPEKQEQERNPWDIPETSVPVKKGALYNGVKQESLWTSLNLVAAKLIGANVDQHRTALIGGGIDQAQQKAFSAYAHQIIRKQHKQNLETLLTVTTIFKPEICGAINIATSDINLNRQMANCSPVDAMQLIGSPYVNAQFARFVAFVHNGNSTVPSMATMVRGIAPYASGGLQTMVKLSNPHGSTHFQLMANMNHRTDALRFFASLKHDPQSGLLVIGTAAAAASRGGRVIRRPSFLLRSEDEERVRTGGVGYRDARGKIAFLY